MGFKEELKKEEVGVGQLSFFHFLFKKKKKKNRSSSSSSILLLLLLSAQILNGA